MCGYSINFSEQDPCGCRPLLYHHSPLAHFPLKSYIHRTQDIITKMDFKLNKTIFLLTLYAEIILPSCCQQPFNSYWASSMNSTGTYSHLFHHNTHKSERRKDLSLVLSHGCLPLHRVQTELHRRIVYWHCGIQQHWTRLRNSVKSLWMRN